MTCKPEREAIIPYMKYATNTGRTRQRLTIIEYVAKSGLFKALQLRNACEMKMGVKRKDGHYFFVEEVVWMMEAGLAVVVHDNVQLSVQQCYGLLCLFLIKPAKYFVFSYLKRAGYVVFPYNSSQMRAENLSDKKWKHSPKPYFPSHLLDNFPTLNSKKQTVSLARCTSKLEIFGIAENFPISRIETFIWKNSLRDNKEFLRPSYWPRFDHFSNCVPTWTEYRIQRAKILRNFPLHSVADSVELPIDYDVYSGSGTFYRNTLSRPIYRLLVLDMLFPFPSSSELHWLSSKVVSGKLLIAVVDQGSVVFYNVNHEIVSLEAAQSFGL
ncbi:unnamed protein product [Thelazia callipaeda]|uniref:tRNA_int_end_N2 domain-containing protein n=1 Tax=Thelazia callipaeda TaxID=103827 RepID=A0A0N5CYW7_THECL|nr:unnamed protein product [Thelazia callipaeda]